jgi:hypothetical protein
MPERRERRRSPRVAIAGQAFGEWTAWSPVRILDVSRGGVQLSGSRRPAVSDTAELRTVFGTRPFSATIEVRWVRAGGPRVAPGGTLFGARFRSLEDRSSKALDRFVGVRD